MLENLAKSRYTAIVMDANPGQPGGSDISPAQMVYSKKPPATGFMAISGQTWKKLSKKEFQQWIKSILI